MKRIRRAALLAVFPVFAACFGAEPSAPAQPVRKPRIGVALGGGAALGLSHIGVLKWFEEHRIPVDVIAGTSMGGLVGGLYATGRSAAEMEQFAEGIDWDWVMQLRPDFRDLTYRRKEDRRDFPNHLEIGLRQGFQLPLGLSSGHGVGIVLSRFTSPYAQLASFDELPIPFRCVATDLLKGEQVVFSSGSLFDALRSTMAIPGVFAPWRVQGRMLVDGALLNNLPVDVARAMGADIVIAVYLEGTPRSEKDMQSILGVAGQSISVMIAADEKQSMALADFVLKPNLNGFESTDYRRGKELEQAGYEAAAAAAPQLEKLALTGEEWAAHLTRRRLRRKDGPFRPEFVRLDGARDTNKAVMENELRQFAGRDLQTGEVESKLNHISGMGRYASAHYGFVRQGGKDGLNIHVREKTYMPPKLDTGFLIDAANGQRVRLGIGGRLTFLDWGGRGSEWRTDMSLGGINRIATEYYWRVKGSRFFVAPRAFYDLANLESYANNVRTAEFKQERYGFGLDVGVGSGRYSELRVGAVFNQVNTEQSTGAAPLPQVDGGFSLVRARYAYEGQDSGIIPRRGFRTVLEGQWVFDSPGGVAAYPVFSGTLGWARLLTEDWSFLSFATGGAKSNRAEPFPLFRLGGSGRVSSLGRDQLLGNRLYFGSAGVLRALGKPTFAGRFYGAAFYELGNAWFEPNPARPYQAGTLGIAGETLIGLVYAGFSVGDKGERKIFFRLGRLY